MALSNEELNKRRLQRQQQRAARKRKNRIRVAIAAGILLLVGLGVFLLLSLDRDTPAPSLPTEISAPTEATEPTEPPSTVIHLAFAGDVNITDTVVAAGGTEYDYQNLFMDVAHVFAQADLAAVNFEGNLCGAPYGSNASAPQTLVEAMNSAGIDLVQLANSYSINRGITGLGNTIDGIRAAGMEPLGVYKDRDDFRQRKGYTLCEVEGIRIAFVAFTKGMDGTALPPGSEDCVNLLYTDYESTYQDVDTDGITGILDAAKAEDPDLIVAMLHWGSENNDTISASQERIVSLLHNNGVDAIIGTHSHFLQKMNLDPETGKFVAYSLGDLLGDAQRAGTQYSVILDLEVTKDRASGNTTISGFSYTPIYQTRDDRNNARILRIHESIAAYEDNYIDCVSTAAYEDMQYSLTRIHARITGEEEE